MMTHVRSPPFVHVEGIHNFRDLGGYVTRFHTDSQPQSVRRNFIFRCAEPSKVTPGGVEKLKSLSITTFFDLRSSPELEKMKARTPVVHIEGIERQFVPVFADKDYSPEQIALRYKDYASNGTGGFTNAYADILGNAAPSYRRILLHIRDKPEEACVIHCTAGKDRTGVLAALILALAGVDDRTIAEEYELTELGLAPWRPVILQYLLNEPALADDKEGAINMVSAKAANMSATLKMIEERYGGVEGYVMDKCGLSIKDVEQIRQNLISREQPIR